MGVFFRLSLEREFSENCRVLPLLSCQREGEARWIFLFPWL